MALLALLCLQSCTLHVTLLVLGIWASRSARSDDVEARAALLMRSDMAPARPAAAPPAAAAPAAAPASQRASQAASSPGASLAANWRRHLQRHLQRLLHQRLVLQLRHLGAVHHLLAMLRECSLERPYQRPLGAGIAPAAGGMGPTQTHPCHHADGGPRLPPPSGAPPRTPCLVTAATIR